MSFSAEAKAELCARPVEKKNLALAELYGVVLCCHSFDSRELRIITGSEPFAKRLPWLLRRCLGLSFDQVPPEQTAGKRSFLLNDPEKLKTLFSAFGAEAGSTLSHHINFGVLEEPGTMEAFVRGAFLAGGSVTDPEKRYHLELSTSHQSVCREMTSVLLDLGFEPKETRRGGNALLYFKRSDAIADFFTAIGAPVTAMKVMNSKAEKEVRNLVTRRINCDTANADKTVAAAQGQIEAIRAAARALGGFDALPEPLKEAALLRITNPALSLADLAKLSVPKVSKSCLSHRLRKIIQLAEKEQTQNG